MKKTITFILMTMLTAVLSLGAAVDVHAEETATTGEKSYDIVFTYGTGEAAKTLELDGQKINATNQPSVTYDQLATLVSTSDKTYTKDDFASVGCSNNAIQNDDTNKLVKVVNPFTSDLDIVIRLASVDSPGTGSEGNPDSTDTSGQDLLLTVKATCTEVVEPPAPEVIDLAGGDYVLQISGAQSYDYTGSAIEPEFTVKKSDGSVTLTAGTDYDVAWNNNVNAGTASVTVTGKEKYKNSLTATFTINKIEVKPVAAPGLVYVKNIKQDLVIVEDPTMTNMVYSMTGGTDYTKYTSAVPKGLDAGEYVVYYHTPGDTNHQEANGNIKVNIDKYPVTITVTGNSSSFSYKYGTERTLSGYTARSSNEDWFPATDAFVKCTKTCSVTKTDVGEYPLGLKDTYFDKHPDKADYAKNYDVTFVVTDGTLTIKKVSLASITMDSKTFTYTGTYYQSWRPNNMPEDTEVRYGKSKDDITAESSCQFVDAGEHTLWYRVYGKNPDNYVEKVGSTKVTIKPKTATLSWPATYPTDGSKVAPTVSNLYSGDSGQVTVEVSVSTSETTTGTKYTVTATGLSGNRASNYALPTSTQSKVYTVTKSGTSTGTKTSTTGTATSKTGLSGTTSRTSTSTGSTSKTGSGTSSASSSSSKTTGSTGSSSSSKGGASSLATGGSGSSTVGVTGADKSIPDGSLDLGEDADASKGTGTGDLLSAMEKDPDKFETPEEEGEDWYAPLNEEDLEDIYEDTYEVDNDTYDSEPGMSYGRAAHLAGPKGHNIILALIISMICGSAITAGVFLILSKRKEKSNL